MSEKDSSKNFTYQRASRENFYDIKSLMLEALENDPKAFSVDFDEFAFNSEFWWEGYVGPFLNGETALMYMCKHDDKAVGIAGITFSYGNRKKHVAHLVWIYVKKEFRGNGISKKLIEYILKDLKPAVSKISLQVVQDQISAVKVYEKLGFEKVGTLQKELKINDEMLDVIIMEKFVEPEILDN